MTEYNDEDLVDYGDGTLSPMTKKSPATTVGALRPVMLQGNAPERLGAPVGGRPVDVVTYVDAIMSASPYTSMGVSTMARGKGPVEVNTHGRSRSASPGKNSTRTAVNSIVRARSMSRPHSQAAPTVAMTERTAPVTVGVVTEGRIESAAQAPL